MKKLNDICIGFYGTPEFSLNFLKDLFLNNIKVSYIVTQPPKNSGRGKKIRLSPVHEWGAKKKIKIYTPSNTEEKNFVNNIMKEKVDINIVVAYGNLLTKKIIDLPNYMSLNVHASLLPRWRGAAPIQRSILSNDKETGVCVMRVDEKLDSGPIINSEKFEIREYDNYDTIYNRTIEVGKSLLKKAILKIINNEINYKFQDESLVTYAKKISKSESEIFWNKSAHEINLKIRAFSKSPGAWTILKNSNTRIKILRAQIIKEEQIEKNSSYNIGDITERFEVKCSKDFLKVEVLQKEGRNPISAKEFLNGNNIKDLKFN